MERPDARERVLPQLTCARDRRGAEPSLETGVVSAGGAATNLTEHVK